jgi:hypothetical protein
MDWKHGYFADNGYTFGYYREMAPCYLAWAALLQGVVAPTRNFRYVDLGCGQGLGLILQAALPSRERVCRGRLHAGPYRPRPPPRAGRRHYERALHRG